MKKLYVLRLSTAAVTLIIAINIANFLISKILIGCFQIDIESPKNWSFLIAVIVSLLVSRIVDQNSYRIYQWIKTHFAFGTK